jgi:hypothetical protein
VRSLLDRLDFEDQLHLLADEKGASLKRLVPVQPEVLAVEARRGGEAGALTAPGILAAALVRRLQHDAPGRAIAPSGRR